MALISFLESVVRIASPHNGPDAIRASINDAVSRNLDETVTLYREGLKDFLREDGPALKRAKNEAVTLFDDISRRRGEYYRMALQGGGDRIDDDARHFYYRAFTNMKEVGHGLRSVLGMAESHIANRHRVYQGVLRDNLMSMLDTVTSLQGILDEYAHAGSLTDHELTQRSNEGMQRINQIQLELLRHIDEEQLSLRSSELYLGLLQFAREIINRYTIVALLQRELNAICASKA